MHCAFLASSPICTSEGAFAFTVGAILEEEEMLLFITWNESLRDRDSNFSMNLSTCIHCLTARHYKVRKKLGVWERKLCNMLYFLKIILIGLFFSNFAAFRDSTNGNRRSKIRSRAWEFTFTQSMRLSSV